MSRSLKLGDGESLPSYLDRLAARLHLSQADLLTELGVDERRRNSVLAFSGVGLPERKIETLASRLALDPNEIRQSLVTRYESIVFELPSTDTFDARWRQSVAAKEWVYVIGSVCCPVCLASEDSVTRARGVWKVVWRLPWSFVCPRHRRLLISHCPSCELQLRSGGGNDLRLARAATVPDPERCGNAAHPDSQVDLRETCGELLSALNTVSVGSGSRSFQAQLTLDAALGGQAQTVGGVDLSPLAFFRDLRSLSSLILRDATVDQLGRLPGFARDRFTAWEEERSSTYRERDKALTRGRAAPRVRAYGRIPRDTGLMAAVVPAALTILEEPTVEAMAERLEGLVDSAQRRNKHTLRSVLADYPLSQPLRAAFEHCLTRRGPLPKRLQKTGSAAKTSISVEEIPQLFWADLFEKNLASLFARGWEVQARRFCSIALAHAVGASTVSRAVAALGLPPSGVTTAYEWTRRLAAEDKLDLFQSKIEALLPIIAARSRPNLADRRQKLRDFVEVPADEWSRICAEAGLRPGRAINRRYAAAWLWAEITGGDYRLAPSVASLVEEGRAPAVVNDRVRRFARSPRGEQLAPALRSLGEALINSEA